MLSLFQKLKSWLANGEKTALATVVETWGSSPRPVGSQMVFSSNDEFAGSVSGGCVENAVIVAAQEVMASCRSKLLDFTVSSDTAFSVGLSCGGKIKIFIQPFSDNKVHHDLLTCVLDKKPASYVMHMTEDGHDFLFIENTSIGDGKDDDSKNYTPSLHSDIAHIPAEILEKINTTTSAAVPSTGPLPKDYFLLRLIPPFQLTVIGAGHIAVKLAALAHVMEFDVVVIDPRAALVTTQRFPKAEIHHKWPDSILPDLPLNKNTALVALSHDPKIDDPALIWAMKNQVKYIGALGSRTMHAQRIERLRQHGFTQDDINRIHAPIGLDIAAKTAEEIALSILAQIVAERNAS
ncbi:MAG: XdhC family protein [Calditrichaeota bacterium]|nr:MAG: XdhC family protein [Calditrichota bacterium]